MHSGSVINVINYPILILKRVFLFKFWHDIVNLLCSIFKIIFSMFGTSIFFGDILISLFFIAHLPALHCWIFCSVQEIKLWETIPIVAKIYINNLTLVCYLFLDVPSLLFLFFWILVTLYISYHLGKLCRCLIRIEVCLGKVTWKEVPDGHWKWVVKAWHALS